MSIETTRAPDAEVPGDPIVARDVHIARLRRQVDELTGSAELLTVRDAEVATLRARLDALLAARRREIEHLERRNAELEALLADAEHRVRHADSLERALTDAESRVREAEGAAVRAADAAAGAASQMPGSGNGREHDLARIASLEAALAARTASQASARSGYGEIDVAFRRRLEDRIAVWRRLFERRIAQQHDALIEKEEIIARLTAGTDAVEEEIDPTDLTRINGIGETIATALHSLGHTGLQDIAALQPSHFDAIDEALGVFKGRAERDRWVEQATDLLQRAARRSDQARPE
ncbi:hypothetical protein HQ535_04455 [bacterium]|nr:hypothetical protein [bacterium]